MSIPQQSPDKLDPAVLAMRSQSEADDLIPVIICYHNRKRMPKAKKRLLKCGCCVRHSLPIITSLATIIKHRELDQWVNSKHVKYVYLDAQVRGVMDVAGKTLKANWAHQNNFTGKGVTVAIVDTGIAKHLDLTKPTNRIIGFYDLVNKRSEPYDDEGHGTHVAGIIAGNGISSNGRYKGIAPEANLVGVKVLNSNGSGSISDVIAGMQWVLNNKRKYKIKVVNLSLGSVALRPALQDPLCRAAARLWRSGLVVVSAAGNSGPAGKTINSPGITSNIITVGAMDDRVTFNTVPPFSSRGPTIDGVSKPDLVVPGVNIKSLLNTGGYVAFSGTSMATPMVSGAAALLLQKYPRLTPFSVKKRLVSATSAINAERQAAGSGLLNLNKLLSAK